MCSLEKLVLPKKIAAHTEIYLWDMISKKSVMKKNTLSGTKPTSFQTPEEAGAQGHNPREEKAALQW